MPGAFFGIFSGELLTYHAAEARENGTYLYDMDFHEICERYKSADERFTMDAFHAGNVSLFLSHYSPLSGCLPFQFTKWLVYHLSPHIKEHDG